jgi:molecular chaperone GrpE
MTEKKDKEKEKEKEEDLSEETGDEAASQENTEERSLQELQQELTEVNDKYVRLYADYENFKRIAERNKQELLKYANEGIMEDLLTVIDHLELALKHSSDESSSQSLSEGVKLTLKELKTVLEKHGLTEIEALNQAFDPSVHHAISQAETDEVEENTVVKELRKGYMLKDRVLRASLVEVSKKPSEAVEAEQE